MPAQPIFIASDHRGFPLKAELIEWLKDNGFDSKDLGTNSEDRCDAGDFAVKLAKEVTAAPEATGVLICGSGQAMAMTANRFQNLRAALCHEPLSARMSRQHNDANVLVMGANMIGTAMAIECLHVFLKTEFQGGRYAERRDKFTAMGGL